MNHRSQGPGGLVPGLILALLLLASPSAARAINPPVHIGQYAHTSWTSRDEYSLGAVYAMAQTPDGYLWLASQAGLVRFDGEKFTPWQPPAGKRLPNLPYSLMVSRNGTLWVGTFSGLVSWDGVELTALSGNERLRDLTARGPRRYGMGRRHREQRRALRNPQRTGAVSRARWRVRNFRLESGGGQRRSSVGWGGNRTLALEARSSQAI